MSAIGYKTYTGIIEDAQLCPMPGAIPYIYLDLYIEEKHELKTLQVNPQMLLEQLRGKLPYTTDILEQINSVRDWLLANVGTKVTIQDFQGAGSSAKWGSRADGKSSPERIDGYIPPEEFDPDNFEYREGIR
jgi:hypothetical protein